jgi:hypothetical protein
MSYTIKYTWLMSNISAIAETLISPFLPLPKISDSQPSSNTFLSFFFFFYGTTAQFRPSRNYVLLTYSEKLNMSFFYEDEVDNPTSKTPNLENQGLSLSVL